ncbi:uncharacterized protein [Diadema setosum]|uniref:uncharacterized protein n=1 Tax=Diadema setosum TaxID=31175 RepID=UPI003B3AE8EC
MPPKKSRRMTSPYPATQPPIDELEQYEDDESVVDGDSLPKPEAEAEAEADEVEGDAPTRKKAGSRIVTNFSEEEKERIICFLQQNPSLYSKRLAGYKDTVAKERLWTDQARRMNCMPYELKTWYDSMRTKLGKLKKAVMTSWRAIDRFTATERWIWYRFQFLLEHIAQNPRSTAEIYTPQRPPPAPHRAPSPEVPEDAPPADTPACTHSMSSTVGAIPDLLIGILETYLAERQSHVHPSTAFGSYVDGSLRSLPPAIRRTAEARIMGVLHECQDEADQQHFRMVNPHQVVAADQE